VTSSTIVPIAPTTEVIRWFAAAIRRPRARPDAARETTRDVGGPGVRIRLRADLLDDDLQALRAPAAPLTHEAWHLHRATCPCLKVRLQHLSRRPSPPVKLQHARIDGGVLPPREIRPPRPTPGPPEVPEHRRRVTCDSRSRCSARSTSPTPAGLRRGRDGSQDARGDGLAVLKAARALPSPPEVVVVTAYGTAESAVAARKAGAADYVEAVLDGRAPNAGRAARGPARHRGPRRAAHRAAHAPVLVAASPSMQAALVAPRQVAATDATVLLLDESGTGKSQLARYIHFHGRRVAGALRGGPRRGAPRGAP
jgi:hypothetical protein